MSAKFGIIDQKCYFCGQDKVIRFREHYIFCPKCSAIYTFNIIQESNCNHIIIGAHIPCVEKPPWFVEGKQKIHIVEYEKDYKHQFCSECGSRCIADGW